MTISVLAFVNVLTFLFRIVSCTSRSESYVVTLSSENFTEITQKGNTLVEFYAPWCHHCETLETKYESVAQDVKKAYPKATIAKLDATKEETITNEYQIEGYPTLLWFDDDESELEEYQGRYEYKEIYDFVSRKMMVKVEALSTLEELETFRKIGDMNFVGHFLDDGKESLFREVASSLDDALVKHHPPYFGILSPNATKELRDELDLCENCIRTVPASHSDGRESKLFDLSACSTTDDDSSTIREDLELYFITESVQPVLSYYPGMIGECQSDSRIKKFVLVIDDPWNMGKRLQPFYDIVDEYAHVLKHVAVDTMEHDSFLKRYHIKEKHFPVVLFMDASGAHGSLITHRLKFNQQTITTEVLRDIYETCIRKGDDCSSHPERPGTAKPPKNDLPNIPVKTMVGVTFQPLVHDAERGREQVVIFFREDDNYSSKALGEFDQIARRNFDSPLDFYKMDVGKNDVADKNIELIRVPSVYFFPNEKKSDPILFKGTHETGPIIDWLRKVVTIPFVGSTDELHYGPEES